jgi:hypothetical protein
MGVGGGGEYEKGKKLQYSVKSGQVLFPKQLLRFADEELSETEAELGDAFLRLPSTSNTGKQSHFPIRLFKGTVSRDGFGF